MTALVFLATWPWQLAARLVRLHVERTDLRALAGTAEARWHR